MGYEFNKISPVSSLAALVGIHVIHISHDQPPVVEIEFFLSSSNIFHYFLRLYTASRFQHFNTTKMVATEIPTTMQQANTLRRVMHEGKRPSMGCWQMIPGSNVSRTLARCGFDWILVDCEHGNIDSTLVSYHKKFRMKFHFNPSSGSKRLFYCPQALFSCAANIIFHVQAWVHVSLTAPCIGIRCFKT